MQRPQTRDFTIDATLDDRGDAFERPTLTKLYTERDLLSTWTRYPDASFLVSKLMCQAARWNCSGY